MLAYTQYFHTWILEYKDTWILEYEYFCIWMSDLVFFWNFYFMCNKEAKNRQPIYCPMKTWLKKDRKKITSLAFWFAVLIMCNVCIGQNMSTEWHKHNITTTQGWSETPMKMALFFNIILLRTQIQIYAVM